MALRLLRSFRKTPAEPSTSVGPALRSPVSSVARAHGDERVRILSLPEFSRLDLQLAADVIWRPGPPELLIRAPESLISEISVEVGSDGLHVHSRSLWGDARALLEIRSGWIDEILLDRDVSLCALSIQTHTLMATLYGDSSARFLGRSEEIHAELYDRARLDAASLQVDLAAVKLSDETSLICHVSGALEAFLSERADLVTLGSPQVMDARREASSPLLRLPPHLLSPSA